MKKFLALSLLLGSAAVFVPAAEAKTNGSNIISPAIELNASVVPQRWRRARVVTRTRVVRRGFRTYREVWQYRYRPNGTVVTRLLSRTRVR
jgi:hypothetical protein